MRVDDSGHQTKTAGVHNGHSRRRLKVGADCHDCAVFDEQILFRNTLYMPDGTSHRRPHRIPPWRHNYKLDRGALAVAGSELWLLERKNKDSAKER